MKAFRGRWIANGRESEGVEAFANKVGKIDIGYVFRQSVYLIVSQSCDLPSDVWTFQSCVYGQEVWKEVIQSGLPFHNLDPFSNELSIVSTFDGRHIISKGTYAGIKFSCLKYIDNNNQLRVETILDDTKMTTVYSKA